MDDRLPYDETPTPKIGAETPCVPEVHLFTHEKNTYRVVLHAKKGLAGWKDEAVVAVEMAAGIDALGNVSWQTAGVSPLLAALFMSLRKKLVVDATPV